MASRSLNALILVTAALAAWVPVPALAQQPLTAPAPEVEIDSGSLSALTAAPPPSQPNTAAPVILTHPSEKHFHPILTAPDVVPDTPAAPAVAVPVPAPSSMTISAPNPAGPTTPAADADTGIVSFPITVKTHTESINPAAPPTEPAPPPDLTQSLSPSPPVAAKPVVAKTAAKPVAAQPVAKAAIKLPPKPPVKPARKTKATPKPAVKAVAKPAVAAAKPAAPKPEALSAMPPMPTVTTNEAAAPATAANLPPLPKPRPAIQKASADFVAKARKEAAAVRPVKIPETGKNAGPAMPAVPPAPVAASPLPPPDKKETMSAADKALLVKDIVAIHDAKEKGKDGTPPLAAKLPVPVPEAVVSVPAAAAALAMATKSAEVPVITATLLPPQVKTPAEKLSEADITAALPAPRKGDVPRPPPDELHGQPQYVTLPFKAATASLDDFMTAALGSKILPQLKAHADWRLQIQAFATPLNKEPISARSISLSRALAVRSWLMDHGIEARRMDLRALGMETDRSPADRVDLVFLDPKNP